MRSGSFFVAAAVCATVLVAPVFAQGTCAQFGPVLQRQGDERAEHRFGYSVAISNDAQWVVVSNPGDGLTVAPELTGAMIYQRTPSGGYTLQRPLLTPPETTATNTFKHVTISGNGRTLAMTSNTVAVIYDRNDQGVWVRIPGTFALPTVTALTNPANRPLELDADGTTVITESTTAVSIYTRAAGAPAGTPFNAGPSFPVPAGEQSFSGVNLAADGAMFATARKAGNNQPGNGRIQVFRKSAGVWSVAESIPVINAVSSPVALSMSHDGRTFLFRSVNAGYWLRETAGAWLQMNTAYFVLPNSAQQFEETACVGLGPDGTWACVASENGAHIMRPQPNNSWAITATVPLQLPYPGGTVPDPANGFDGTSIDLTPDGRFAVVGHGFASSVRDQQTIMQYLGVAYLLDLRPPASVVSQPVGQAVTAGGSASFTFAVSSAVTPQYQWRRNGVNIADGPSGTGSTYGGSQSAMLTVSGVQSGDQFAIFDCVVVNACSNLTSNPAVLSVQTGGTGGQCAADIGAVGGVPGSDGLLDNNDFIVFIDWFFNHTGCP